MKKTEKQFPDPAEQAIDKHTEDIKVLRELLDDNSRQIVDLPPEKTRFIMTVKNHYKVIASDWIGIGANLRLSNDLVIILNGQASPNTPNDFTKAYLIFVNSPSSLRKPQVVQRPTEKILSIRYPLDYVVTVERTLKESKSCYCWIGNFSDSSQNATNIHADIHAEM